MSLSVSGVSESRWVRIAGLLVAVGGTSIAWVVDEINQQWPPPLDRIWIWLVVAAVGTTLLTAGFITVSIGFGSTPVRTNARYRQAMALRLAAGNLAAPPLFIGWWVDDPRGLGTIEREEILLAPLVVLGGYLCALAAWRLWRRSQRLMAINAVEAMQTDPRPPVLYLRSFKDDGETLFDSEESHTMTRAHRWLEATTVEQQSAGALSAVGPVVAVGRPGEPLPELGAARLYVAHEAWQGEVRSLMGRATLVVVRVGSSPGVLWEVDQVLEHVPRRRVIFAIIGDGPVCDEIVARLEPELGAAWVASLPEPARHGRVVNVIRRMLFLRPMDRRLGSLICFPADQPRVIDLRRPRSDGYRQFTSRWQRLLRPDRSLREAWSQVFTALGIPQAAGRHKSPLLTIILALLWGFLGVHWFYLGRWRRGLLYIALSPILLLSWWLSWVDALRLIWCGWPSFDARFLDSSRPASVPAPESTSIARRHQTTFRPQPLRKVQDAAPDTPQTGQPAQSP
jgi:hypothetical protein